MYRAVECNEDATTLDSFIDPIEKMKALDRSYGPAIAAGRFDSLLLGDGLISFLVPVALIRHDDMDVASKLPVFTRSFG